MSRSLALKFGGLSSSTGIVKLGISGSVFVENIVSEEFSSIDNISFLSKLTSEGLPLIETSVSGFVYHFVCSQSVLNILCSSNLVITGIDSSGTTVGSGEISLQPLLHQTLSFGSHFETLFGISVSVSIDEFLGPVEDACGDWGVVHIQAGSGLFSLPYSLGSKLNHFSFSLEIPSLFLSIPLVAGEVQESQEEGKSNFPLKISTRRMYENLLIFDIMDKDFARLSLADSIDFIEFEKIVSANSMKEKILEKFGNLKSFFFSCCIGDNENFHQKISRKLSSLQTEREIFVYCGRKSLEKLIEEKNSVDFNFVINVLEISSPGKLSKTQEESLIAEKENLKKISEKFSFSGKFTNLKFHEKNTLISLAKEINNSELLPLNESFCENIRKFQSTSECLFFSEEDKLFDCFESFFSYFKISQGFSFPEISDSTEFRLSPKISQDFSTFYFPKLDQEKPHKTPIEEFKYRLNQLLKYDWSDSEYLSMLNRFFENTDSEILGISRTEKDQVFSRIFSEIDEIILENSGNFFKGENEPKIWESVFYTFSRNLKSITRVAKDCEMREDFIRAEALHRKCVSVAKENFVEAQTDLCHFLARTTSDFVSLATELKVLISLKSAENSLEIYSLLAITLANLKEFDTSIKIISLAHYMSAKSSGLLFALLSFVYEMKGEKRISRKFFEICRNLSSEGFSETLEFLVKWKAVGSNLAFNFLSLYDKQLQLSEFGLKAKITYFARIEKNPVRVFEELTCWNSRIAMAAIDNESKDIKNIKTSEEFAYYESLLDEVLISKVEKFPVSFPKNIKNEKLILRQVAKLVNGNRKNTSEAKELLMRVKELKGEKWTSESTWWLMLMSDCVGEEASFSRSYLQQAISLDPESIKIWKKLFLLDYKTANKTGALETLGSFCKRLITIRDVSDYHLISSRDLIEVGTCLVNMQLFKEAEYLATLALCKLDDSVELRILLADSLVGQRRFPRALLEYEVAAGIVQASESSKLIDIENKCVTICRELRNKEYFESMRYVFGQKESYILPQSN